MSFSSYRVATVNGAIRRMGPNNLDTKLSANGVNDLVVVLEVAQPATRVLLLWSHFNSGTCEDSSLDDTVPLGSVD